MYIQKATKYRKDVTLKKKCVPFQHYNGRVGRCARPNIEAGHKVGDPKRVLNFCCKYLKM
jgi:hypothetical protein